MAEIVVVDYGVGNLKSVRRGFEKVDATVVLSSDPDVIATANKLVLPGVGAFEGGMKGLQSAGVISAISHFVQKGNSLLGICLGMQMLLDCSEENGLHAGLGYIAGEVKKIPHKDNGVQARKIPHIGWSDLLFNDDAGQDKSSLRVIKPNDFCYFVHSYMAVPKNNADLLAQCEYSGIKITAAIKKENITGLQFHPEKSGLVGLKILDNFVHE